MKEDIGCRCASRYGNWKQLNVEYYPALQKSKVRPYCGEISGTLQNEMCGLLSVWDKTPLYVCMSITGVDVFFKNLEGNSDTRLQHG